MFDIYADTRMSGNINNWMFFGDGNGDAAWKQDHTEIIYPPVWSNKRFDRGPGNAPDLYAHDLAKEDYAFLTSHCFEDIDISVKLKCFYGSVVHGGIIFRAVDSTRFYVVDIADMGRKACQYEVILWAQDGSGYRKQLARGYAWHSVVPEKLVQGGVKTLDEWYNSSPEWIEVRIQASGTYIRVSVDGNIIFDLRDNTYATGFSGLMARGGACFRDLTVMGNSGEQKGQFKVHEGEMPPEYFIPGNSQPNGKNAYPAVCCTDDGSAMVVWAAEGGDECCKSGYSHRILFSVLKEGEKEWSSTQSIYNYEGSEKVCDPSSIYSHRNGEITCLVNEYSVTEASGGSDIFCIRSKDGGKSWSNDGILGINRETLDGKIFLYSPMRRLSDGRVVMTGYEANNSSGEDNSKRCDRSVLYVSRDDGYTWDEPIYFDRNNKDHNECMVVETEPGKLIAFMRTLRGKNMWMSKSEDGGMTWSSLEQSNVSGECPYMIRHSSGALVFFSRGYGSFIKLSFDNGSTWTKECRISPASAMIGMTEMKDGRIIIIMHEGYRIPGKIRGQFFKITPEGPIPA